MQRFINNLYIKIFLSFWAILCVTAAFSFGITRMASTDNFAAPDWAVKGLGKFAQRIEQDPRVLERLDNPRQHKRLGRHYIVNQQGELLHPHPINRGMRKFIANHDQLGDPRLSFNDKHIMVGPVPLKLGEQDLLLYVERRATPEQMRALRARGSSPWLLASIAVVLSLVLCSLLARHIVNPLKRLQNSANKVSLGDLEAELPEIQRGDEIGQLSQSLQRMVSTLNKAIVNQRRLLSDISHELRSPLTRLNMALAIHKKRQGDEPLPSELMRIEKESQRLEQMIAALLSLSRMQVNAQQQELDFIPWLQGLSEDCRFEAEQLDKRFEAELPANLSLVCYPELLSSAIENICRNALRYARGRVVMKVQVGQGQLSICVRDDGPGLPEAELHDIFRPFYRSGEARDRDSGGVGLGLAIAESAVRQHGGEIAAENIQPSGLEVCISLPLK